MVQKSGTPFPWKLGRHQNVDLRVCTRVICSKAICRYQVTKTEIIFCFTLFTIILFFFCLVILPKYTFYISIITVGYNLIRWQIAFYCIPAITNVTLFKLLLFIDKFKFVKTSKSNCLYFLFLSVFIILTFTNFDFELQTTNWKIHGNLENQSNLTCQILCE